jgi:hypothetical protein
MNPVAARATFMVALFLTVFVIFFAVATHAPAPIPVAVAAIPR